MDQWGTQLESVSGKGIWRKHWGKQSLVLQGWSPALLRERGRWGCLGSGGGPRVLCSGTGPSGPAVPELCSMLAGEMLCVGGKAGTV